MVLVCSCAYMVPSTLVSLLVVHLCGGMGLSSIHISRMVLGVFTCLSTPPQQNGVPVFTLNSEPNAIGKKSHLRESLAESQGFTQ